MEIDGEVWALNGITQIYNHRNDRINSTGFFSLFNIDACPKAQFWAL
jgi:hypothetical protein